jgi:hypothetical protein
VKLRIIHSRHVATADFLKRFAESIDATKESSRDDSAINRTKPIDVMRKCGREPTMAVAIAHSARNMKSRSRHSIKWSDHDHALQGFPARQVDGFSVR